MLAMAWMLMCAVAAVASPIAFAIVSAAAIRQSARSANIKRLKHEWKVAQQQPFQQHRWLREGMEAAEHAEKKAEMNLRNQERSIMQHALLEMQWEQALEKAACMEEDILTTTAADNAAIRKKEEATEDKAAQQFFNETKVVADGIRCMPKRKQYSVDFKKIQGAFLDHYGLHCSMYRATRVLAQAHFQQQDGDGLQQVHPHSTECEWTGYVSKRWSEFGHMRFSTVAEVRLVAALQLGMAPDEIRLFLPREGRELNNQKRLCDYGICNTDRIEVKLQARLLGGGKPHDPQPEAVGTSQLVQVESAPTDDGTSCLDAEELHGAMSELAIGMCSGMEAAQGPAHSFTPLISTDQAWQPDSSSQNCQCCRINFGFFKWKHHCRSCGHIFCSSCLVTFQSHKVCKLCQQSLKVFNC
jgi:hypothetical protein